MILIVDNYDSFVHNVARYFAELGAATRVVRNDAVTDADLAGQGHRHLARPLHAAGGRPVDRHRRVASPAASRSSASAWATR